MKGLAATALVNHDHESSDPSSSQRKRASGFLDSLSSTTDLQQKRGRQEVAHDMPEGKAKKMTAGTSTPTSYDEAVKASNQKLIYTRKESDGDNYMNNMDLCKV